jgi:hypothetical protein
MMEKRKILKIWIVALVALIAVSVCVVFAVLRIISERQLVYEGEIPVADTNEIPVFAAEVSTISLPIKADYAALASEIQGAVRKQMTIPGPVSKAPEGGENIWQEKPLKVVFYYTADLLSLDFSLGDGSAVAAQVAAMRRVLEGLKGTFAWKSAQAQIERLREQEISLADCPVLTVTGEIRLHGSIQKKWYVWDPSLNDLDNCEWKYIAEGYYDGKFRFSKLYSVRLDESAKLIFGDLGHANMEPLDLAKLTVLKIPFSDWFGGLKALVMPKLEDKVDAALKEHVNVDYLTPFYEKGWVALHKPIKLTSGVWMVFNPEEFEVAQLSGSGTMLETTITVRGRPRVVLGDKPAVHEAEPMPAVRLVEETKGGLHVVVDANVPLDEAERRLNKELGGLEKIIYKQAKVKVKVPKARIYSRENWLRLELLLTKPFRGSVFLEGAPKYDAEKNELYVEGLDFTVDTKNVLAKSASWLLENPLFKDYLQRKVRLPVGGPLADVGKALSGYEKEIAHGVVLQFGTMSFKMLGVYNTREAMHLIVQADGSAKVYIL